MRKGESIMLYPILALSEESTQEAIVKLHFALATENAKGAEFLRVDFCKQECASRLRGAVLRVFLFSVKERKGESSVSVFHIISARAALSQ